MRISMLVIVYALLVGCSCFFLTNRSAVQPAGYDYGTQGYACFVDGRIDDAIASYRKAWAEARVYDVPRQVAKYQCNIGRCHYEKDAYDSVLACCISAYADFIRCGDSVSARNAAGFASLAYSGKGNADSAFAWYNIGKAGFTLKNEKTFWTSVYARILWNRDQSAQSLDYFNSALTGYKKAEDFQSMATIEFCKAYICFVRADYPCAKVAIDSALMLGDRAAVRYNRWKIVLLASAIARAQNDASNAEWYYNRAVASAPRGIAVPALATLSTYRRNL